MACVLVCICGEGIKNFASLYNEYDPVVLVQVGDPETPLKAITDVQSRATAPGILLRKMEVSVLTY